jgi:CRP/FNR family transcriptional regulator
MAEFQRLLRLLRESFLFSDLSLEESEALARAVSVESFEIGDTIIDREQPNTALWVLIEGPAVVKDVFDGGLEMDLYNLQPGDLFGEVSYSDNLPPSASVIAKGQTRVMRIPFKELEVFFAAHPGTELKVLRKLAQTFSQRLRRANSEIRKSFMATLGYTEWMVKAT